jgi:hypothetical protein
MSVAELQLDFLQPPPPLAHWRWLGWLALAAAVGGTAVWSGAYSTLVQTRDAAQARNDLLGQRARSNAPRRAAPPDAQTLADMQRANAVIDQLTVPWNALFDAVEAADAQGLGVLSLAPNARDRSLRLTGEAKSLDALLAYVERMAAQPALAQVHLLGYSTVVRDGAPVVSFSLAAGWRQSP